MSKRFRIYENTNEIGQGARFDGNGPVAVYIYGTGLGLQTFSTLNDMLVSKPTWGLDWIDS